MPSGRLGRRKCALPSNRRFAHFNTRGSDAARRCAPGKALFRLIAALAAQFLLTAAAASAQDMSPLTGEVWGSGNRNVVVILHGDGGPGRYDAYAAALAKSKPATTVITLNRPAFAYKGKRSPGQNPSKDHYTRSNNQRLAASLQAIKASMKPGRLIVLGHSGGSGQLGTVIATHPGTVDVAVLAACPCNVPQWRLHRRGSNNWTQSQSPHTVAAKVPRSTRVIAVTMEGDNNTQPRFAQEYIALAKAAGARAEMVIPKGGSHNWSDYQPHVDALIRRYLK